MSSWLWQRQQSGIAYTCSDVTCPGTIQRAYVAESSIAVSREVKGSSGALSLLGTIMITSEFNDAFHGCLQACRAWRGPPHTAKCNEPRARATLCCIHPLIQYSPTEKDTPGDADPFSQRRDISFPKYVIEKKTDYVTG